MKQKKIIRIVAIIIAIALALSLLMIPFAGVAFAAEAEEDGVTVLFTHDLHDQLLPADRTDENGVTASSGGYARLKTAMDAVRAAHEATITLDAGDFSMGSLFQTIYTTDAPELRMLGALGVDATTLGSHEYDYGPGGLARMLDAARESGDPLPQIVQANYQTAAGGDEDGQALTQAMNDYPVTDYTILERNGVKIAVFGIMGTGSAMYVLNAGRVLEDPIETAKAVVEEIKAAENPDMIVCLFHSGASAGEKESEDETLAKEVPDIDLIVSGHTRAVLDAPLQVGDTFIVSAGAYCENLGVITLLPGGNGRWTLGEYTLQPIDASLSEDPAIAEMADGFKAIVQEDYLNAYGLTFDQVLAENDVRFTPLDALADTEEETGLGDLLADAYIYAAKQSGSADDAPIALSIVPMGLVGASLPLGELTTADAFAALPFGIGPDGTVGYPLVNVYLTGKELSAVAEIDASVSTLIPGARLYTSGVSYTYNSERIMMDRVTDLTLTMEDGSTAWPASDTLYRVVTDLYSVQMLPTVKEQANGLLKITPKDADGNEITDFTTAVLHDQNGNEIKAWQAVASYLASFAPDAGSVGAVPQAYASSQGRKTITSDNSLSGLIGSPGTPTIMAAGFALLVIIIIFLLGLRFIYRKNNPDREPDHL